MRLRTCAISGLALLASPLAAQVPDSLRTYVLQGDDEGRFYEFTRLEADGRETQGWVVAHWTGRWEASGEDHVTGLQMVHTVQDMDANPPPLLLGVQMIVGERGIDIRRVTRVSHERPIETEVFAPGNWFLPAPPEVGRTWTASSGRHRSWARIESADAPSPNPLIESRECLKKVTVAVRPAPEGGVDAEIEETYWAPGHGLIWIDVWQGTLADLEWDTLTDEQMEGILDRLGDLPVSATLQLVPRDTPVTAGQSTQGGPLP